MNRIRIGIVGAGNVAARHAAVLSSFPDVEIAGIADTVLDKARVLAGEYGVPAYSGHEALLAADSLDAVYVCVPPFAHGTPELDALSLGLPLFVEKPLALDAATAEKIAAEAARRGVPTAVGHHWRYLDVLDRARALLDGRPVRLALAHWLDKIPPVGWWPHRAMSGGQVLEQAIHVLDLARTLVGEVGEVHAVPSAATDGQEGDVDRATAAVLRFRNGAAGLLATSCLLGWKHRAGLEVQADGIALDLGEDELVTHTSEGRRVERDPGHARTRVDRAFVDAVRGTGDDVRAPYQEALRTHRLACALTSSAGLGRPVALEDGDG
ncbi:Gfo/Idh/MocA family protein [Spongiactinospora sp. 9N601]|uniref:Gfo/Idh/MocA family protein n=1 Tax=Spongiactinospora sp. 9N601 TaxID=3375149 RepID=UPI00379A9378